VLRRFAPALALVGAILAPAGAGPVGAPEPERALTDAKRERIDRGELVVRTRSIGGFPWPDITVYARVAASPAEVMAVYADFDAHASFLPEMVHRWIVGRHRPTVWRVFYE